MSMLQETVKRLNGLPCHPPLLVCNEEQRFLAAEQLRRLGMEDVSILLEPEGRNTAPAITLAALHAIRDGQDPLLMVLAADHHIQDVQAFQAGVRQGMILAESGKLVTFGIVPQSAETGYGYIQKGTQLDQGGYTVQQFVEKPDVQTALSYLESGKYVWNSGMFMFRAGVYLEELGRFQPLMLEACKQAMDLATEDLDFVRVNTDAFLACPEDSIDYAVMEKTENAVIVPMDAGWCDVGSWSALWEISPQDEQGNACKGDVVIKETTNSLILSGSRLVATLGVQDLVVVETEDAVLVASREKAQDIKAIVQELKALKRSEHITHREVYRPWGSYNSIDVGGRYQVKRITVKPGATLSTQLHHHRAEHWIVVSGTARVTNGQESFLVAENESTYIPLGQVHALENPGNIPLELIEVQSGSYLGEDDIVRMEDRYGRV
jgi:mannose-1-phosphate guanylyltransferase